MELSVVTTVRNERYLEQTLRSVLRACDGDDPELLVVEDGDQELPRIGLDGVRYARPWSAPRGCMAARDWGIVNASHDACVVVDAHMDFDTGLFAAFAERLRSDPKAILCGRCTGLDPVAWKGRGRAGRGAWIVWRSGDDPVTPLGLAWRDDASPEDEEEVSAVLGACYGLSRRWYSEGLRRPWSFGTGWGTDEELLSIVNWLCGGSNRVLPFTVRHWFRPLTAPHPDGPAAGCAARWTNRLRLIRLLPMPETWRRDLHFVAYENDDVRKVSPYIELQLAAEDHSGYAGYLASRERSFEAWRERWCLERDPAPAGSEPH